MSKSRGSLRRMRREVEADRAAAMRCPGCARRNVIAIKNGRATCVNCGHFVPRDLYAVCGNGVPELTCPACEKNAVRVRGQEAYFEGGVEAYCAECHVLLEVQANVEITFTDPEIV